MKNIFVLALQVLMALYIIFLSGALFVFTLPFVSIQLVSIMLVVWALIARNINKKHVSKSARKGIRYFKEGPYEFIRYPIYAGLVLFLSTYVQEYFTFDRAIVFILFIVLVLISVKNDERANGEAFKHEFTEYQKQTKKLIPYVF